MRGLRANVLNAFHNDQHCHIKNKCIGDDTKAAARQSPNYIKKTKKNKIWRKTIFNMADGLITPYNVARGTGIMTLNSPGGSTLQCGMWFWDHDIQFTKWQ